MKEKVAVSGVETSEGPERKRTNHRGGLAAQSPLFPLPPSGRGCRIRHSEAGADAVKLAQPSLRKLLCRLLGGGALGGR